MARHIELSIDRDEPYHPVRLVARCCGGEHQTIVNMDAASARSLAKRLQTYADTAAAVEADHMGLPPQ